MNTLLETICYRSKTLADGSSPVMLRLTKNGKRTYVSLHISSCHSLRKTFGRQVYNMNSENSELALVKLMELFNHSSVAITKRYLGLRQEEILETYDCLTF